MTDKMKFPKTMKEFIDSYSFKDEEQIYTNGSELIPVFRVEQALEHYEKEIGNKAIDEFAERLKESLLNNWRHFLSTDSDGFDWITTDAVHTHIDELLIRMKGENE